MRLCALSCVLNIEVIMRWIWLLFFSFQASAANYNVVFINPSIIENPFWDNASLFMQHVATDLDIDLEIIDVNSRYDSVKVAEEISQREKKPDAVVYIFFHRASAPILEIFEKAKINSFIFNTDIPAQEAKQVGRPREKFKYWIGHMLPDDEMAGYMQAKLLFKAAREKNLIKDGNIDMVAMTGGRDASGALLRNRGLQRFVDETPELNLKQIVFTYWKGEIAKANILHLMRRYNNDIKLVWNASDELALGTMEALKDMSFKPGKDVLVGGVDWLSEAINEVKNNTLTVTMGQHFMEGGWVLVLIHDYLKGLDFADTGGVRRLSTMSAITDKNVDKYMVLNKRDVMESIDFRTYSRFYHPEIKQYNFSLETIMEKVEASE